MSQRFNQRTQRHRNWMATPASPWMWIAGFFVIFSLFDLWRCTS